jgi:hypothetical protein
LGDAIRRLLELGAKQARELRDGAETLVAVQEGAPAWLAQSCACG